MRFAYDSRANALAIAVAEGQIARTEQLDPGTLVDIDAYGNVLTIEVISPARLWPLEEIASAYTISPDDLRVLRDMFASGRAYTFSPTADVSGEDRAIELAGV